MSGIRSFISEGVGALQRYGPGGSQSIGQQIRTNRHVIRFALGEVHHPRRFVAALGGYRDALARQNALFVRQQVDDVTDAMRHVNASALVVARVRNTGAKPSVAADFMRRLGRAHEADSELTGLHRATSEAMDLHNNELGIAIALRHGRGASEQALEGAVLRALADGKGLVLDAPTAAAPRPSTAADLQRVLRDPSILTTS